MTASRPSLVVLLLPGVLTVYFSFNAGGFFAGSPAVAAVVLALLLLLRVALADHPFEGLSGGLALALGALALFAGWTLVSAAWSGATWRAIFEFDRAFLYLLGLLLFGSMVRTSDHVRMLLWGLAAGLVAVCLAGFISRTLPELWPTAPASTRERLSFPVTYWNALGLQAALGAALCLHLASSKREPRLAAILGAASVPPVAATLVLTLSRGAIAAAAVALLGYIVLARPRALLSGLVSTVPTGLLGGLSAYNAELLTSEDPTAPAAVAQGGELALTVAGLSIVAAAVRAAFLFVVDPRLGRLPLVPHSYRRAVIGGTATLTVVGALGAALALDLPGGVERQYRAFAETPVTNEGADIRSRLGQVGGNGRVDYWRIALDAFADRELSGVGAGTYESLWAQDRPRPGHVLDAHSLYVEVLGELGIVGLGLLLVALGAVLVGLARHVRGRNRSLYAALFSAALAWAFHAGVDWHWEMPAVTFWFFAAGGAALAAAPSERPLLGAPGRLGRLAIGLALLIPAVVAALIAVSQVHLSKAQGALSRGQCTEAIDSARTSISTFGVRPEPYEALGYCNVRLGKTEDGVAAFRRAVDRDPDNWQYWYGLAIARAATNADPRPAAHKALELNPLEEDARRLVELFEVDSPKQWKRRAEAAPLPPDLRSP